jgi:hypothetical protein
MAWRQNIIKKLRELVGEVGQSNLALGVRPCGHQRRGHAAKWRGHVSKHEKTSTKRLTACSKVIIIHSDYEMVSLCKPDDCDPNVQHMLLWGAWAGGRVRQGSCHGEESVHVRQACAGWWPVRRSDAVAEQELCKQVQALQQRVRVLHQARQVSRACAGGPGFQFPDQRLLGFVRTFCCLQSAPAKRAA